MAGHNAISRVQAALSDRPHGLIDNWLRHIKDIYLAHSAELDATEDRELCHDRMCELNVIQQSANVCHTTIVQDAWRRGQPLAVHGWIYSLSDGLIRDLSVTTEGPAQVRPLYRMARITRVQPVRDPLDVRRRRGLRIA